MDRPKHRRFILLGLVFLAGGMLLVGRHSFFGTTEQPTSAPAATVAAQPAEVQPDEVVLSSDEATTADEPSQSAATATQGGFRGKVLDAATRRPIKEFEVRLIAVRKDGDSARFEEPVSKTFRNEAGRFVWNDVPASTCWVAVSAPGYQLFDLGEMKIDASKTAREMVIPLLHGYVVHGRVFDRSTGAGIPEAYISYREASSWQDDMKQRATARSKDDGSFVLDGVPGGSLTLSVQHKEFGSRQLEILADDEIPFQEVALSGGGSISGTVTTAAGSPAKARVMLFGQSAANMSETDDSGRFSFEHLPAGSYDLATSGSGGGARQTIVLGEDERKEGIALTFVPGRTVRGLIVGLRPEEYPRTHVGLSGRQRAGPYLQARPDERGAYLIEGVPPGKAQLSVRTESRMLFKTIEVPADQDVTVNLVLPPGVRLTGRLTQEGQPAAQKRIWIRPTDSRAGAQYHATTSEQGQYEVEGLALGDYHVMVDEDLDRRISIAGDTVLNIDIPSVQLGGSVREDGGIVPIVGADVYLRGVESATAHVHNRKQTDDFGQFKLTGIEPGEIMLTVYKPGYELYREKIAYSAPITNRKVTLRKGGGVEVRAQFAAGKERMRGIMITEEVPNNEWGIDIWVPLDRDGLGYMPSALAGSNLQIYVRADKPIVIKEWDGQALELKL